MGQYTIKSYIRIRRALELSTNTLMHFKKVNHAKFLVFYLSCIANIALVILHIKHGQLEDVTVVLKKVLLNLH